MATENELEALVKSLAQAVEDGLRYFEGPGATPQIVVGEWGPREILGHCLYWHDTTAEGMESVAAGGAPFHIDGPVDEMNARAVARYEGREIPQLIEDARALQERLARAARVLNDLDATVVERPHEGGHLTARQRLEMIARHWRGHITEMESAAGD